MSALSIENLTLRYGSKKILENLNLSDLHRGQLIGILGPNGVGKSTLLRAIANLGNFDGTMKFDGENLHNMKALQRSSIMGYLPQTLPQGTSLIAYEAVISALRSVRPDLDKQKIEALVETTFTQLDIRHLAFKPLNNLSGGQRQMVGLAQVMVKRPALLLLDEPTSALDLRWQIGVFDVVRKHIEDHNALCLMPIHDINLALRHCDRLILLGKGRLLAFGTPKEVMTLSNLQSAYFVDGRVETCSQNMPFVIAEHALPMTHPNTHLEGER